jgi:hypothetical protein
LFLFHSVPSLSSDGWVKYISIDGFCWTDARLWCFDGGLECTNDSMEIEEPPGVATVSLYVVVAGFLYYTHQNEWLYGSRTKGTYVLEFRFAPPLSNGLAEPNRGALDWLSRVLPSEVLHMC